MDYDDGGPAFPPGESGPMGMSLRDWFAGQALAALGADMRNWTITGAVYDIGLRVELLAALTGEPRHDR